MLRRLLKNKKGQGLVEYALLVAGVALICAAAVSVLGHKANDLIGAVAAILPGSHSDDNAPILSGKLIETASAGATPAIGLDLATIQGASDTPRLGNNVLGFTVGSEGMAGLLVEAGDN